MPTIFWLGNIRIIVNTKDHGHPHVHVLGPDAKAKIRIDTVEVIESAGFSQKALKKIVAFIEQSQAVLQEKWNEIQEDQG